MDIGIQKLYINKKNNILFWIVFLLLSGNILSQNLSQLQLVEKPVMIVSEIISREIKDSNGEVCAGIMVVTDLDGLRFDSYNKIVRINSLPGKDLLFVSPTEELVTIYKSGYAPFQLVLRDHGIKLESGKVWQIKISGEVKKELISISIITNPANEGIYIDGELKGTGSTHKVAPGKHVLKIIKKGFLQIIDTINVSTDKILFSYDLQLNKPVLATIRSNPDGASIILNEIDKGKTTKQIFELAGKYKIRLRKSGFQDYETEIEIKSNEKNDFTFNLKKNTATLNVNVNPPDAEIIIDGDIKNGNLFDLKLGTHHFEIKKENYITVYDTLNVTSIDSIVKNYTLLNNTSRIFLSINPKDAEIEINQQKYKDVNGVEFPVGNYLIEIKKDGYDTYSEAFSLERDQQLRKDIYLRPIFGSLQLSVTPIESSVHLSQNEKQIKKWNGSRLVDSIIVGNYMLQAEYPGYEKFVKQIKIEKNNIAIIEIALQPYKKSTDVIINSIISENSSVKNIRYEKNESNYVIKFDLDGDIRDDYKIDLYLMDKINPQFEKQLILVTGDVNEGKFAGRDRKIIWNYQQEYKGGILNDNLYLKLVVEKLSGGIPWYVWAGGAVVGGVVAILLGGSSNNTGNSNQSNVSIPTPPIPPGN